jgi:putative peptidoglycan lipid II flippase
MGQAGKTTKAVFFVMISTFVSKLLGFFREILLGSKYGTTYITDAYLISITIPTILFTSVATAIVTAYIPVYAQVRLEKGEVESIRLTNKILNVITGAFVVLCAFGIIFTKPVVSIIAIGFTNEALDLAIRLTRIIFPMIVFIGISQIFTGFLQLNNEFTIPALINVPYNIIIIFMLIFNDYFGVYGLIYGTLIGAAFQVIMQYPFARRNKYKYSILFDFKDSYVRKVGSLSIPILVGTTVQQINAFVDRMLASGLAEGSISALNFANKLNTFVYGIFSIPISIVIFPILSKLSSENNKEKVKDIFVSCINIITLLILPITVGAVVLRIPIVSVLFERGEFDNRATMLTSSALLFYSLGMVFYGYREILCRMFYSLHDTKTPMVNGVIALISNIILNLILVRYMQHSGLAFATSITAIITTILLFRHLRKRIKNIGGVNIIITAIKCSIASLVMGVVVYYLDLYINSMMNISNSVIHALFLAFTISIGVIIYSLLVYIFRIKEINWMIELLKNRLLSEKN